MMLAISDGDIREDAFTFTNLVLKPLIEYIRWIHFFPAQKTTTIMVLADCCHIAWKLQ